MTDFVLKTLAIEAFFTYNTTVIAPDTLVSSVVTTSFTHYQIHPIISLDWLKCNINDFTFSSNLEDLYF